MLVKMVFTIHPKRENLETTSTLQIVIGSP